MISLLVIGNEILSAQIKDFNLGYMLRELGKAGIPVDEVRMVRDEMPALVEAIRALSARSDFLISTGGIGPTHDDLTLQAYALAFGQDMVRHPDLERRIRGYYGDQLKEHDLLHADVPANITLVESDHAHWPILQVENCFVLPGLPEIFIKKFQGVLSTLPPASELSYAEVRTTEGEASFAAELTRIQDAEPLVEIGSYPRFNHPSYATKITLKSRDPKALNETYQRLKKLFSVRQSLAGHFGPRQFDPDTLPSDKA